MASYDVASSITPSEPVQLSERYLARPYDVDARDGKSGETALHVSAEAGRADEVRALLAAGADPASQR